MECGIGVHCAPWCDERFPKVCNDLFDANDIREKSESEIPGSKSIKRSQLRTLSVVFEFHYDHVSLGGLARSRRGSKDSTWFTP